MKKISTIGQAVNDLTERFAAAGIDTPRLDARILVGGVMDLEPSLLFARADLPLSAAQAETLAVYTQRHLLKEPVSRILGRREFWGLTFRITPDVLDPRPDTETLVAAALTLRPVFAGRHVRVLDLGTGSGCILLSILSDWPEAEGVGVDVSPAAIKVAAANAAHLNFQNRASFCASEWAQNTTGAFDVIVSNPPYISENEILTLALEVGFDPLLALRAGADGLAAYRALIPQAARALAPSGRLILEVGAGQAKAVTQILVDNCFRIEAENRDLGGIPRCLVARAAD